MFDDFMTRATLAGIGVSLAAAPLGCFIVWRRMAYFGEATAHAALLGVSISLAFETRVFSNATVIGMDLGKRSDPLLWQSVEPAERRSNVVYLPALFEKEGIVTDVMFDSVFSPNQDGINDVFNLEFVLIKVQEPTPTISIFDISGRYVAKLSGKNRGGKTLVSWDGIEESGATADPGLYLYKINPEADTNKDSFMGSFALVY